jgi:hypothetical protein
VNQVRRERFNVLEYILSQLILGTPSAVNVVGGPSNDLNVPLGQRLC